MVYGSSDSDLGNDGLLPTLKSLGEGALVPQIELTPKNAEGLKWITPKADRLQLTTGALSTRYIIHKSSKSRRDSREYVVEGVGDVPADGSGAPLDGVAASGPAVPVEGTDSSRMQVGHHGQSQHNRHFQNRRNGSTIPQDDLEGSEVVVVKVGAQEHSRQNPGKGRRT